MMYNRDNGKQEHMTETRERTSYQQMDYSSRNEYVEEPVTAEIDDFDAMLYETSKSNDVVQQAVPAPRPISYEEAIKPSPTTMQFGSQERVKSEIEIKRELMGPYDADPYRYEDKQYKITAKAKVLIAVYAIVVATIFALIVLNTRLLNKMNSEVAMMETQIRVLQDHKHELEQELSFVSSDAEIERRAVEMGMTR